ncbi:PAS domain-containing protein [Polyangium aurulentum]|uniref:PAS domain-containing protein n=1 Tax=Polyangium aurulentum TaxID=2567896 RepID=UPI0010AE4EDE|nr:PAS domain-containing protein [Polyangium aurulentum]UQA58290.1 PAS domain-containing protein [Polyangium aurulentum]
MRDASSPALQAIGPEELLDAMGLAAALVDAEGLIVATNGAWRDLLGGGEGARGGSLFALAADEEARRAARAVLAGEARRGSFERAYEDGRALRFTITPARKAGAAPAAGPAVVTAIDAAAERRAEEERRRTEAIIGALPDLVFIVDQECRYLDARGAPEQMAAARESIVGRKPSDIMPPALAADLEALLRRAFSTGAPQVIEYELTVPVGKRWFEARTVPIAGDPTAMLAVVRDVTERRESEQRLREHKEMLGLAGEVARFGGWRFDRANNKLNWTAEVYRIYEVDPSFELNGESAMSFYPEEERPRVIEAFVRAQERGEPFDIEVPFTTARGNARWVRVISRPHIDADGQVIEVAGSCQDITERKEAEQAIRDLNAKLEQRVRERTAELEASMAELETFSYSVSHDLRAPLRGIDGFSKALLEDYGETLDDRARSYIDRVRNAASRMGRLIDDLLQLSRVTRKPVERTRVDLSALAASVGEELLATWPGREVELSIEPALAVRADPGLLRIALVNLLDNAFKFTSKHQKARIQVGAMPACGARPSGFFVRDDGAGFDMEYAGRLFTPFQRLHTTSEFEGTGIGLATVRRIMKKHGGEVWAEAAIERGATVYFTLP